MGTAPTDAGGIDSRWPDAESNTPINNLNGMFQAEVVRALQHWSNVTDVAFSQVADSGHDVDAAGAAGDLRVGAHSFTPPASTIAHGYYPPVNGVTIAGDLHFDTAETWVFGFPGTGVDMFQVAAHEVGHTLGLGHDGPPPTPTALMNPSYSESFVGVQLDDVQGMQAIYGAAVVASLTIDADDDPLHGDQADDGSADTFTLTRRGGVLDVLVNGNYAVSVDFASLTDITINGSGDDDTVILDYGGGEVIPAGGITYTGGESGGDNDVLRIENGTIDLVYDATGPGAGAVTASGGTLTFSELEPVIVTSVLGTLTVNVTDGLGHTVDIQNDLVTGPVAGLSEVIIDGGLESVQFTNPTVLLAVNSLGGADTVNLNAMDAGWSADIEIDSGAGSDTVIVNATTDGTTTEITTNFGSDEVLIGITSFGAFATGVGNTSNIRGDVLVTDEPFDVSRLVIDDSSDIADQDIFVENIVGVGGTFATYGHRIRGIAGVVGDTANILYDTDQDGPEGISDLSVASGTGDDDLTVDFDAAGAAAFQSPLADGFLDGFDFIRDAGATGEFGGSIVGAEFNRLFLRGGGEIDSIAYIADTINSGTIVFEEPGLIFGFFRTIRGWNWLFF